MNDVRSPRQVTATIAKASGLAALTLLVVGLGGWGALLLAFAGPSAPILRIGLIVAFCLASAGTVVAIFLRRWRWQAIATFLAVFAPLVLLWTSLEPTNNRDWQSSVAVLPYATVAGDYVTVHNIRNFDYRSENDYTIAYYDKTFDVSKLESVDIVTSYWMGPAVAHVFVSFGFAGDDYLAVSIEVRKSRGKAYSTLAGFFRQYELIYVVADERDVIRLRTNYRHDPPEDVYVYRSRSSPEAARRLFMEYMERLDHLRTHPEFYNTLTTNCTTDIWMDDRVNPGRVPLNWKVIVSGYLPEYLYQEGRLEDTGLSFPALERRAHVNARARDADSATDFSRRIRAWSDVARG